MKHLLLPVRVSAMVAPSSFHTRMYGPEHSRIHQSLVWCKSRAILHLQSTRSCLSGSRTIPCCVRLLRSFCPSLFDAVEIIRRGRKMKSAWPAWFMFYLTSFQCVWSAARDVQLPNPHVCACVCWFSRSIRGLDVYIVAWFFFQLFHRMYHK